MTTICGANCDECDFKKSCKGCAETCGKPFGGRCIAAEYINIGGIVKYNEFKDKLRGEINDLLRTLDFSETPALYEMPGFYVNLEYELPNGEKVKYLCDNNMYLCCQIEFEECERCVGVVADTEFILICTYGANGTDPELVIFKRR